jgi:hypothetical protein
LFEKCPTEMFKKNVRQKGPKNVCHKLSKQKYRYENVRQKMSDRKCPTENVRQKMSDRKCPTEISSENVRQKCTTDKKCFQKSDRKFVTQMLDTK